MSTIAHYRIADKIGHGGMGEVFRATDTKLKRDVAIKVLPDKYAQDKDRMARFSREAQVLASLNHPNIASIYGLEESNGKQALVMELVEGETLADRLVRGPIPLEEAIDIAKQVARALEEAHDQGVVHRDLKPANVKLTAEGTVKLLDFGLAKALDGEPSSSSPDFSQSPTLSAAATAAGLIFGTGSYMSPEQARGQKVDRRADIWSFGVVLYEMLSGTRIFTGDTLTDILASVLKSELDWSALPDDVPAPIHQLLRRCLERDSKQRLQSIGEARIIIDNYLGDPSPVEAPHEPVAATSPQPLWRRTVPWALLALASFTAVLLAVAPRREQPESPMRLKVQISDEPLFLSLGASGVLSPDGTRIATVVGDENATNLFIRSLDQLEGARIASGSGAAAPYQPFFSPDGKWLGYVTSNELLKVPVSGGTALKLCDLERSRGASWGPDDTIIFTPSPNSPLFRVPAAGGEPEAIATLDAEAGEATHRWPQVLPGGEAVVFTSHTQAAGGFETANVEILNLETGERKVLQRGGSYARYVPSGHLVYVNQGTIFAMPFDLGKLEPTGSPAPVVQEVAWSLAHGGAQFEFSETGRMIYLKEENLVPEYPVIWVDENGSTAPLWDEQGSYANPRLSPDGKRLALTVLREGNWDIWVYDMERGVSTRLTFDEAVDTEQVWSPDGEYLVFSSDRNGAENLYRKRADGSGDLKQLTDSQEDQWATSWSTDGRFLAFMSFEEGFDVWVQPMDEDTEPEPFLTTPFNELNPSFSPNGRLLAYTSNESGRSEVYVRPFPLRGGKWQVSDGGGAYPRWSQDGGRLYYRTDVGLMVATVDTSGETFRTGKAQPLLEGWFQGGTAGLGLAGNVFSDYDVAPDGKRFVMFPGADDSGQGLHPHATLITRWFDELTRTFAVGGN